MAFLVALLVMLLTSPARSIGFTLVFFAAFFGLLVGLGHLIIYIRRGEMSRQARGRIIILSVFLTLLLMFRSTQSLNWIDALILILVVAGLLFYSSHRST